jgi:hypothetical protein
MNVFFLPAYINTAAAQTIQYSSENIFSNYPDNLQMVANIAGNHHLLCFTSKENPEIFIFSQELKFQSKIRLPFKFPEKSELRIIPFADFYYVYVHPRLSQEYLFWKVDGNGNLTDFSASFQKLLQSQSNNLKLGFQLIASQEELWMVYHTALTDPRKSTMMIVQTDSLLNVVFTHKVMYDFKRDEERIQQEVLMFGRYLLILKTARSGTLLELMKVNLATGYTITHTFQSSGYFYSQSAFSYNNADSTVTVSSLLTEPRTTGRPKQFVFMSRLNKILIEQVPFTVLKSQFVKNTNSNFLLIEGLSKWVRLTDQATTSSQDFRVPDPDDLTEAKVTLGKYYTNSDDGVRFSLLDKNFKIASDSLIPNTKNSYTVKANQFARFNANDKEYLLVGQQFSRISKGLLMINTNDAHQLIYTDIRVNDRNNYLLSKSQTIPKKGIIIPYTNKREAGLIKIIVEQ